MQFYLGAEDIDRIVKALLPVLESYLPDQTKDQQYVFLTTLVNRFSKEKTFSNKEELDKLVKDIANKLGSNIITRGSPDFSCVYFDVVYTQHVVVNK